MVCMRKKTATRHQGLKWHYPYLGQPEHPVAETLILTRQSIFTSIFFPLIYVRLGNYFWLLKYVCRDDV